MPASGGPNGSAFHPNSASYNAWAATASAVCSELMDQAPASLMT